MSGAYETKCATPTGLPRRMAERRARNATWRTRSTHGTARNYDMRWPAQLPGDGTSQICNHKRSCHLRLKGDLYGHGICDTANRVVVVAMSSDRNRALSKNHHLMSSRSHAIFRRALAVVIAACEELFRAACTRCMRTKHENPLHSVRLLQP